MPNMGKSKIGSIDTTPSGSASLVQSVTKNAIIAMVTACGMAKNGCDTIKKSSPIPMPMAIFFIYSSLNMLSI